MRNYKKNRESIIIMNKFLNKIFVKIQVSVCRPCWFGTYLEVQFLRHGVDWSQEYQSVSDNTRLGRCILALTKKASIPPYRESSLTMLLKESLTGNCRTCLIVTIADEDSLMSKNRFPSLKLPWDSESLLAILTPKSQLKELWTWKMRQ